jgi:toxin ParE1/3/4
LSGFSLDPVAIRQLDEIHAYTLDRWGDVQAERYARGLFALFAEIATRRILWRPIPAKLGVRGFQARYEQHNVYWREAGADEVRIFSVLHVRMQQSARLQESEP